MGERQMSALEESSGEMQSIKTWLERWVWIYDIFGFIILSNIFKYNTGWSEFFRTWTDLVSTGPWLGYFSINGVTLPILGIEIIALFYLGKAFAKSNIDMLASLFSSDRVPQDIQSLKDRKEFTLMLIVNFAQYVILESVIKTPWLVCVIFLSLSCFYLRFNFLQRKTVRAVIDDPVYNMKEDDPHKQFIERRRLAALNYLFERRHTSREMILFLASSAGLALALLAMFYGLRWGNSVTYALLVVGILLNEITIASWRRAVNKEFDTINAAQIRDDIRRAEARRNDLRSNHK